MWTDIDKKISYSTRTTSLITLRIITSRLERFFSKNNVPQQVLVFLFQGLTVVFKTVAIAVLTPKKEASAAHIFPCASCL